MSSKKPISLQSWNVNGIRACIKKGFWDWFDETGADIVCLQETKITEKDFLAIAHEHHLIPLEPIAGAMNYAPTGDNPLYFALACAKKPGYSGTLILTKIKPEKIEIGLGNDEFDSEGRTVVAYYKNFVLFNCYFPNGGPELARIPYKLKYNDFLFKKLQALRKKNPNIVITGDFNVAHTEIDIKNAKANENNSGFTKVEREWFTKLLAKKYVDTFRTLHPEARDAYTWWTYRFNAREKNVGWRIDYFVVTQEMLKHVDAAGINSAQLGSDHCPVGLKIKFT